VVQVPLTQLVFSSEERVRKGVDKIMKNIKAATQVRLDSFFTAAPTKDTPKKRKV